MISRVRTVRSKPKVSPEKIRASCSPSYHRLHDGKDDVGNVGRFDPRRFWGEPWELPRNPHDLWRSNGRTVVIDGAKRLQQATIVNMWRNKNRLSHYLRNLTFLRAPIFDQSIHSCGLHGSIDPPFPKVLSPKPQAPSYCQ